MSNIIEKISRLYHSFMWWRVLRNTKPEKLAELRDEAIEENRRGETEEWIPRDQQVNNDSIDVED